MKLLFTLSLISIISLGVAQKENPGKAEAKKLVHAGMIKVASDDCAGAILDFEAAMKKDSSNLDAYLKRAFCYSQAGNFEGAIADYTTVIRLTPDQTLAYISRGAAKNKLKKYNEAIADFNKAISLDPKNGQAYYNRGESKKGLGDEKGACEDWHTSAKNGNEEGKIVMKNNRCK